VDQQAGLKVIPRGKSQLVGTKMGKTERKLYRQGGRRMGITSDRKVADITLGELKELIKEVMLEALDPDYGLELQDEVVQALRESFQEKERGEGIALEEAKNRLGLGQCTR
jgi:hypothetical protein